LTPNKITFFDSFLKQSDALDRLKGMVQDAVPLNVPLPDDLLVCHGMIRELLQKLHESNHELAGVTHRLDLLLKRLYGPKGEPLWSAAAARSGPPDRLTMFVAALSGLTALSSILPRRSVSRSSRAGKAADFVWSHKGAHAVSAVRFVN
jgi:hypothetical protein